MMSSEVLIRLDVSRETMERLATYVTMLEKWNRRINLIAKGTAPQVWDRHIADSAQLLLYAPPLVGHWLDLGSGGGLPGLVVAIMGGDRGQVKRVTLVESDARKSVFLSEVARALDLDVTVLNQRVETLTNQVADVVSARALADLESLFSYAEPHCAAKGVLLFPKGAMHTQEIATAEKSWSFNKHIHQSMTDPNAAVLEIQQLKRRIES
ncbi:16S rRNA (guanine(527)-N(7))-methyltransferase RsmG [Pseudotabrizicola sp. L79]|uniref:16S rRNA (guanine(527)-N(7))-methyltransferase RsmG n=1 Tax=Pseudotabrizicola sp. L79 TaxID=3118402 RepID=UPI002F91C323